MASGSGNTIAASQYAKVKQTWAPAGLIKHNAIVYNPTNKKEKKMGWFRKKFNGWVRQAWNDAQDVEEVAVKSPGGVSGKSSIRFTIYAASGGYIIEHYKHDRYRESDGPELTIVNNGESLGTAVEHILTMESLKA